MIQKTIALVPIKEIAILNPRARNQVTFAGIVASIKAVGLKRPVSVCRRPEIAGDVFRYNLICGQGRMEAFLSLGETEIPALVTETSKEECLLKSLVENIARRPPSPHALYREVRLLKGRGYNSEQIAAKLGMHISYVYDLVNLLTRGETKLLQDVEARRIPITVAITIADGKNADIQRALSEAYEKGEIRGTRLETAKRIIARHVADIEKNLKPKTKPVSLSPAVLIQEYERHTRRQKALVRRAALARRRLLIITSLMRHLLADDNFHTLLRAESLVTMPGHLAARVKEAGA